MPEAGRCTAKRQAGLHRATRRQSGCKVRHYREQPLPVMVARSPASYLFAAAPTHLRAIVRFWTLVFKKNSRVFLTR